MNVITVAAAKVGFIMGKYIRVKIAISPSPSMRAASMVSWGKLREDCLNSSIRNGVAQRMRNEIVTIYDSARFARTVSAGLASKTGAGKGPIPHGPWRSLQR